MPQPAPRDNGTGSSLDPPGQNFAAAATKTTLIFSRSESAAPSNLCGAEAEYVVRLAFYPLRPGQSRSPFHLP
jgi:hypothetical protein